jgi:hypothetical protein
MMADEESIFDTVSAAVDQQKSQATSQDLTKRPSAAEKSPPDAAQEPASEAGKPEEAAETSEERTRDASGRFLPKEPKEPKEPKAEEPESEDLAEEKPEEQEAAPEEPKRPDISRPPRRLPVRTKERWQTYPPELREDIWAREEEFNNAFKQYDGLGNFVRACHQVGRPASDVANDYMSVEAKFRSDPIEGIIYTLQRTGHNPEMVIEEIVRRVEAARNGQQVPRPQPQPQPTGLTRADINAAIEERENQAKISAFEEDPGNIHLEPVGYNGEIGRIRKTMVAFLKEGVASDLKDAYDKACRAYGLAPYGNGAASPEKKSAAVDRSRAAAKAIGGAPAYNSNAQAKTPNDGNLSVYDTVRAAVERQQRGS